MGTLDTGAAGQFLTFTLTDEVFAVEIAQVREVLEFSSVTRVPRTPDFMEGVINLRGSVVPVLDMRKKFRMPAAERTVDSCVIIIEVPVEDDTTVLGALVDSVNEVMEMGDGEIEPPPKIGTGLNTEFIRGMGKRDEHFVIILNTDKVFSDEELSAIQRTGQGESSRPSGDNAGAPPG